MFWTNVSHNSGPFVSSDLYILLHSACCIVYVTSTYRVNKYKYLPDNVEEGDKPERCNIEKIQRLTMVHTMLVMNVLAAAAVANLKTVGSNAVWVSVYLRKPAVGLDYLATTNV